MLSYMMTVPTATPQRKAIVLSSIIIIIIINFNYNDFLTSDYAIISNSYCIIKLPEVDI